MSVVGSAVQAGASIANTNNTNKTNLQIAQDTNKTNAANVVATNKANFEIAQMSNEYNQQMLERQIEQEWDMWNAQNEYNSASSQRQRLEDAGLNPYLMMDGGSAGTASSMTSPSAQPAVVPQMQAAQAQGATMMPADMSGFAGLRDIATEFVSLLKSEEEIKGLQLQNEGVNIENQYKADRFMVEMYKNLKEAGLADSKRVGQDIMNKFQPEMLQSEIRQRNTETMFTQLRADGQLVANLTAMEWYKVLPQQIQNELTTEALRINNLKLQGKLTEAQVRTEVNRSVTEFYKSRIAHDDAAVSNATIKDRIEKVAQELTHAINNSGPDSFMSIFWQNAGKKPMVGRPDDDSRTYYPGWLW